jgi:two-component system, OmpR family, phosphate regulon sensor histidine kinase PhoR
METINSSEIMNDKTKLGNFLTVMKDESSRLETQVERVLQISALEKNELMMNLRPVNVNDTILCTMKNFELYSKIKNASINMVYDGHQPLIMGDEEHIRNMFSNLIDNALKYSNGRKPCITISTKQVNSHVTITVADNGIGMNHKELKKVFEKFYRIPTGDVHNIKGFGLGLSYVKTIVALHKGKIKAESEPGVGSKFTIQFNSVN